ncbi:MAG: hypothetical protein ACM3ML_18785 [Micromonosporaceae bacterium]
MLGLVAWLYIGVEIALYAAEINVVICTGRRHISPDTGPEQLATCGFAGAPEERREPHIPVSQTRQPFGISFQNG